MGNQKYFDDMIDRKLLDMHTAYLATVLSVSGTRAKIQPLGLYKQYGEAAQTQAPVSNVPIAVQKIGTNATINIVTNVTTSITKVGDNITDIILNVEKSDISVPTISTVAAGDTVICVCCDRDISAAKNGDNTTPALGHHTLSSSVIVGVL